MTWEEVLLRADLIGKDLQYIQEPQGGKEGDKSRYVFRGPIKGVRWKKKKIQFSFGWMARRGENETTWYRWHFKDLEIDPRESKLEVNGSDILFTLPYIGSAIILVSHENLAEQDVSPLAPRG